MYYINIYLRAGKHAKPPCYICFLQKPSYRISQVTLAKPYNRGCDEVTILIIYMYDRNDLICESISEITILDRAFSDLTLER